MVCECCGGGKRVIDRLSGTWVNCPKCFSAVVEAVSTTVGDDLVETPDILDTLGIPLIYRGIKYSDEMIYRQGDSYVGTDLSELANICNEVRDSLLYGSLPLCSMYIHSPSFIDINVWVYTVQRIALKKGFSVVPYITVNELSKEVTDYGISDKYMSYMTAQLCILDISSRTSVVAGDTLADLVNCRAKRGLATICTGYWAADVICKGQSNLRYLITQDERRLNVLRGNSVHFKRTNGVKKYNTPPIQIDTEKVNDAVQLMG